MKKTYFSVIFLLTPLCVGALCAQTQKTTQAVNDFVIIRNRPFVYLKFDHIGQGEPRSEDEPASRIWLRLINNCRVPIIVHTFGVPEGSPKFEQGVMYKVVANPPVLGMVIEGFKTGQTNEPMSHKEQATPTQTRSDETPEGYMFHVGSFQSLAPEEAILFSVPANHFDKRWHLEIPIEFDLPSGKGPPDPSTGGQPVIVIDFSLWDLPPGVRKELEKE